jgi:hypothetical protein
MCTITGNVIKHCLSLPSRGGPLPQKLRRQLAAGGGKELVCLPNIKEKNSINRKVYQFHLRTRVLTAVPYRLQNILEEHWWKICRDLVSQSPNILIHLVKVFIFNFDEIDSNCMLNITA